MVQAQEWLDKKYPKEIRSNITEINISKNYNILENEYLVGNLKLEGFKNLKKFDCSRNSITNLDMNDKKLNCCGNKLKELKINNLNNLELLYCSYNKLINLNLINCLNLNKINCDNNKIKEIKLPLNNQRLEILNLNSNNLLYQDLNIFSKFINLKRLDIGNNEFKERKYNKIYGSLELLKNLEKLEYLEISDTDIDKGLEYLSDSVEEIGCSIFNRGQCGVKKIKDKLCLFVSFEDDGYFTCKFQPWKMLNKLEEKNKQLEKDFEEERSIRISLQDQINEYFQKNLQLQNDLRQIDMENQQLQKKLSNLQIQNINQQSDSIIHQFSAFENQIEEFDDSFQEEEEEEGSDCSFEVVSQEIIE
ncbi:unnamed protein product [Rhizophagus irregularis]|nr:unnamed protein product [Rhizophagus irregularis]